jgi:hypothetical protein
VLVPKMLLPKMLLPKMLLPKMLLPKMLLPKSFLVLARRSRQEPGLNQDHRRQDAVLKN